MTLSVFYTPCLHPDRVFMDLPEQVAFFPVGLDDFAGYAQTSQKKACPVSVRNAVDASAKSLPLSPAEAKAALREMLHMGEEYAAAGMLKELAAQQVINSQSRRGPRPGEFADLERFAETGCLAVEPAPRVSDWGSASAEAMAASASSIRQALIECQKVLLLAFSLEERTSEVEKLEKRYRDVEKALKESLSEGSSVESTQTEEADSDLRTETADTESDLPWRLIVDAMLPFLPEKAVMFTADSAMAHDLREAGMLQPFPEDLFAFCAQWPQSLVTGMLYVCLPAWRLVGRRGPLPERPWLNRDIEVLVARPTSGWLA